MATGNSGTMNLYYENMKANVGISVICSDSSADIASLAKTVEETGFDSLWLPEHPILPVSILQHIEPSVYESYKRLVDPFVALARASAVTQTIKLGTGVCLVPERNPLLLAKEVATLDHISGGRFIFGIGAGWIKEETEIMGGDFPHRWTQTREAVLAMKELWTNEESEFHGRYYDFPPVRSFPKPIQRPHPPILLGSDGVNPKIFKRVLEWGSGWMPTEVTPDEIRQGRSVLNNLAAGAGRNPDRFEIIAWGMAGQFRDKESIEELKSAGANKVIIRLVHSGNGEAQREIEEIARLVLD